MFNRQNSGLMVLRYLVGLLGRNAHIIFNIVSQMGVPQRILFLLLKESGIYQMNVLEVSVLSRHCGSSFSAFLLLFISLELTSLVSFLVLTHFFLLFISNAYFLIFPACLSFSPLSSDLGCMQLLYACWRFFLNWKDSQTGMHFIPRGM